MTAISFAFQLLGLVPLLIQGVQGTSEALEWGTDKVKNMVEDDRDPTDEEWAELNERINSLRTQLHQD